MASYVSPNYNPAYYDLPVFEAPVDMAFKVAQQKQQQFDDGLRQVQGQYQQMLSLDLTNDNTIAKRDAFMKQAEEKLKNIATADFSLQENVNAANNIYKPLTQDQDVLMDLSYTKSNKSAYNQLLQDKMSTDDKRRNNVSSFNEEYITRRMRDLKTATPEQLKSYAPAKYVRAVNFNELLNGYAKDLGFKYVEQKEDGIYMRTTEGGQSSFLPYNTFANSQLRTNPEAMAYMDVIADVQYRRDIDKYTATLGSPELAKQFIAENSVKEQYDFYDKLHKEQVKINSEVISRRDEFIKKYGPEIEKDAELKKTLTEYQNIIKSGEDKVKSFEKVRFGFDPKNIQVEPGKDKTEYQRNLENYRFNATSAYQSSMIRDVASNWALGLSSVKQETKTDKNDTYFGIKEMELKVLEEQVKLKQAENKLNEDKSKNNSKSGDQVGTDGEVIIPFTPVGQDVNPVISEKYKTFKNEKAGNIKAQINTELNLAENILKNSEYSSILAPLKTIYDNITNGKLHENTVNSLSKEQKEVILKLGKEAVSLGMSKDTPLDDNGIYTAISTILENRVKTTDVDATGLQLFQQKENLKNLQNAYASIDKEVSNNVLNNKKYEGFVKTDDKGSEFVSEDDYVRNKLSNFIKANAKGSTYVTSGSMSQMPTEITALSSKDLEIASENFKKEYEDKKNEFEKDFSKYLDTHPNTTAFDYFKGKPDSKMGMSFTQLKLSFEDKDNTSNVAESVLPQILHNSRSEEQLNERNVNNMGLTSAAKKEKFLYMIHQLPANLGDIKSESGELLYTPMGPTGTPSYKFTPSVKALKDLEIQYKEDKEGMAILNNIKTHGITVYTRLNNEVETQTAGYYSVIAKNIDGGNGYDYQIGKIITDITNGGFEMKVKKLANTYQISGKYIDVDGTSKPIDVTIPLERLDDAVRKMQGDFYNSYLMYKQKQKQTSSTKSTYDLNEWKKKLNID